MACWACCGMLLVLAAAGHGQVLSMTLPDHPRLILSATEIGSVRERIRTIPWVKSAFEKLVAEAAKELAEPVKLPDRGGQSPHWYACPDDATKLRTLSPTEHQCPTCGKVYSGYPYDDSLLTQVHNQWAEQLLECGFLWQVTGEAKYRDRAVDILLGYAAIYEGYPLHKIDGTAGVSGGKMGSHTLNESVWLIRMAQGADLIWSSLTAEQQRAAETGLFRPAAAVIQQHKMGIHNIQCWKNSAVGLVGLLLSDPDLVGDAVESEHGFKAQIAKGINDDGQWYEGAWGYHFYALGALMPLAEAGERCGLGLYAYQRGGKQLSNLFDGPLNLAMPDLLLPAFNDSSTTGFSGGDGAYEYALARYGRPEYARAISPAKRGGLPAIIMGVDPLPELPVREVAGANHEAAGYAVLQHGAGDTATWACLKYGPHGGGHGHPDKLNLLLWHHGRQLGVDPGVASYRVALQTEWFRASLAHNTLTIDEANQQPATGKCLGYAQSPGLSVVLADAGPIAEDVQYRRAVALFGNRLVLVLDEVTADREHTFDFTWHNAGTWATAPVGDLVALPDKDGYKHLRQVVRLGGELPAIKVDDALSIRLSATAGEVWAGYGFGRKANDQVTATIQRVRGKSARVGWAIALDGDAVQARIDGDALVATLGGQSYRLALTADEAAAVVAHGPHGELAGQP